MPRTAALCLVTLVAALAAAGEAAKPAPKKKPEPKLTRLEAWADRIQYHGKKNAFEFTGNVTVIREDMRVDCERMDGAIDPKTRRITKVRATGGVEMVSVGEIRRTGSGERPTIGKPPQDAWQATCGKAEYDLKAGRLIMSGKTKEGRPRLRRGDGYGEADMIVFIPDEGYYELLGSPIIHGAMATGPVRQPAKPATATPATER